jgi:hypothetical protein
MKSRKEFYKRIKGPLLFILLSGVIVFTIVAKKRSVSEMETSFSDLYHNRLIAENYIYKINSQINQKKMSLAVGSIETNLINKNKNNEVIKELLSDFSKTKLTSQEQIVFEVIKGDIQRLNKLELTPHNHSERSIYLTALYDKILSNLDVLSAIQMTEGRRIFDEISRIVSTSILITELEWVVIIISLLSMYGLIKKRNLNGEFVKNFTLN